MGKQEIKTAESDFNLRSDPEFRDARDYKIHEFCCRKSERTVSYGTARDRDPSPAWNFILHISDGRVSA